MKNQKHIAPACGCSEDTVTNLLKRYSECYARGDLNPGKDNSACWFGAVPVLVAFYIILKGLGVL